MLLVLVAALPMAALAVLMAWRAFEAEARLAAFVTPNVPSEAGLLLARRLAVLGLVLAAGLAASALGIRMAVVDGLRRLGKAMDTWRAGGTFTMDQSAVTAWELRGLAASFERATHAILRQEAELSEAIQQQELLTREIHHRVKNNLQIVASLLNLQASRIRQPETRAEFQSARDRVRALATLHRHLYATGELNAIEMQPFLQELCGQLFSAMGERVGERIALEIEAEAIEISADQAVPLSLIVTEAVSNAVKYAFPQGRHGHISIRLAAAEDTLSLRIEDDGVGIPAGRSETEEGVRDGIGLQLIRGFVRQLGATLLIEEGNGTRYMVAVPLRTLTAPGGRPAEPAATNP
jgi:two-component sensor histidine kinase